MSWCFQKCSYRIDRLSGCTGGSFTILSSDWVLTFWITAGCVSDRFMRSLLKVYSVVKVAGMKNSKCSCRTCPTHSLKWALQVFTCHLMGTIILRTLSLQQSQTSPHPPIAPSFVPLLVWWTSSLPTVAGLLGLYRVPRMSFYGHRHFMLPVTLSANSTRLCTDASRQGSRDRVRHGPLFKRDLVFCLTQNLNTQSIVLQTLFPITPSQTTSGNWLWCSGNP